MAANDTSAAALRVLLHIKEKSCNDFSTQYFFPTTTHYPWLSPEHALATPQKEESSRKKNTEFLSKRSIISVVHLAVHVCPPRAPAITATSAADLCALSS